MADWTGDQFVLGGGLDLENPPFKLKPGQLRACSNYECQLSGGYRRIDGYLRYDGHAAQGSVTHVPIPGGVGATDAVGVVGTFILNDVVYAFRGGIDSGAVVQPITLYKATASGWSAVDLGKYLRFTNGSVEVLEGQTITGNTSAATAVVRRINIGSGNYSGPTFASGRFAIDTITGTFQDAEDLKVAGGVVAGCVGTQTANAILQDTKLIECIVTNFYGATNLTRCYGCCTGGSANRAFEFDGSVFIFIETGMTVDTPTHIGAHRNNLFLSFPGGSLQNSGTGTPLNWAPRVGAAELGIGDDVTGLMNNGSNTLAVMGQKSLNLLMGTSDLDWNLQQITTSIGGIAQTIVDGGKQTLFMDSTGINIITPPQIYGGVYGTDSISRSIRQLFIDKSVEASVVCSVWMRRKNQYRVFLSDKSVLCGTIYAGQLQGWSTFDLADQVNCVFSGLVSGVEKVYIGTQSGYLMTLDSGTSFDGSAIASSLTLPYNYHKAPDRDKQWIKLTLEVDTLDDITLAVATTYDYGADAQEAIVDTVTIPTSGGFDLPEVYLEGISRNIGFVFTHSSSTVRPFALEAALLHFNVYGIHR